MSTVPLTSYRRVGSGHTPGLPRLLEALLALLFLVLSSPLLLLASAAVALTSRGPILFRQRRVGRRGEHFELLKLRTMRAGSETGLQVTARGDSRITPVGRVLRATKLDELPALWNVVRGELSLVGPRPEVPRYVELKDPLWRKALQVRPGLTDPVTLSLRNEEVLLAGLPPAERERFYREAIQPWKLRGYSDYLDRRTAWTDIEVLLRTAVAVVFPHRVPPPSLTELRQAAERESGPVLRPASARGLALLVRPLQFALDGAVLVCAFGLAYLLRFDFA